MDRTGHVRLMGKVLPYLKSKKLKIESDHRIVAVAMVCLSSCGVQVVAIRASKRNLVLWLILLIKQ